MPVMCIMASRTDMGRCGSTRWRLPSASLLPHLEVTELGDEAADGVGGANMPRSYRLSSATPVIGLVIEKRRYTVSSAGTSRSRSACPSVVACATCPCRATTTWQPAILPGSM